MPCWRTQKLMIPFCRDVSLLSWQLVNFIFTSLSIWQITIHIIVLRFFLLHFNFFLSLKVATKNVRDHTLRSFFLSFFYVFLSLKITTKTAKISPSILSLFLSFFLSFFLSRSQFSLLLRSLTSQLVCFFTFLFRCSKLQITWFVHFFSFFFTFFFSFFKDYNKMSEISPFILSFFLSSFFFLSRSQFSLLLRSLTSQLVCFFTFLFRCGKVQITWFVHFFSFFFTFFFSFFKDYNKMSEISPFILSFFLSSFFL